MFFISVINFFTIKRPRKSTEIEDFISVIVPLRNEAHNINGLLQSLKVQKYLQRVEFIFLDDNSEDLTFDLVTASISGRADMQLIQGSPVPDGWIGKTWALQQLFNASVGEIIVSLDADVRIKPDAINKAVTKLKSTGLNFISAYPRQIALTLPERLIQPLLQWSWMTTLLLAIAERSPFSSMAVANGQFFIVQRSALVTSKGYEIIKACVLDDVFLARVLVKSGSHGVVISGAEIAECRMYESWSEIKAGYGKSLRYAFGSHLGSLFAVLCIFLTGIAPLILGVAGYAWGWIGYACVTFTRMLSAIRSKNRVFDSLFHPLSSALLIYLIFYSYFSREDIKWKGRTL